MRCMGKRIVVETWLEAGAWVVVAAVIAGCDVALAVEAPGQASSRASEAMAVQAFGDADHSCGEWSDGCVVCRRGAGCSLPGLACQPGPTACTKPMEQAPVK